MMDTFIELNSAIIPACAKSNMPIGYEDGYNYLLINGCLNEYITT